MNQAVKRNLERFPGDFMFELTREEILGISQNVTSLRLLKFSKSARAFTEHGALMASTVLNTPRAIAMNVYIMRAFVKMREDLATNAAILRRLAEIDQTLCCTGWTPIPFSAPPPTVRMRGGPPSRRSRFIRHSELSPRTMRENGLIPGRQSSGRPCHKEHGQCLSPNGKTSPPQLLFQSAFSNNVSVRDPPAG